MAVGIGSVGTVEVMEDFMSMQDDGGLTIVDATGIAFNNLRLNAISGDVVMDQDVTLGGGVATFSGAGGAGDGISIASAPLIPRDGHMTIETRFKYAVWTDVQAFVGFQETWDRDEAVNPFTLNGTTLTDNSVGNCWGIYYDTQATTDDWRAAASQAGTIVSASGTLGVRANSTLTADKFIIIRVELNPSGGGDVYISDALGDSFRLVDNLPNGTLSTTAAYHPVVTLLAQSTGDPLISVDYVRIRGGRSWTT